MASSRAPLLGDRVKAFAIRLEAGAMVGTGQTAIEQEFSIAADKLEHLRVGLELPAIESLPRPRQKDC